MKSRYRLRGLGAGDQVFSAQATNTACPPGFHWQDDEVAIRGISACVPDKVVTLQLPPHPTTTTAPATLDTAPSPSSQTAIPVVLPTATCPEPWPLWWLLVAAAAGAAGGVYAAKNAKKVKKNAGRIAYNTGRRFLLGV